MAARVCRDCGLAWPLDFNDRCLECNGVLAYTFNEDPMDRAASTSYKRHADFKAWLERETPSARAERQAKAERERAITAAALADLEAQLTS